ncbi:DUF7882 family protein [Microbacterium nanhaiense]|nr:hypothetical protein [Microbacterium nanhaiense]
MGTFHYGSATDLLRINDHVLAHLKLVITTKLRRDESFTLSWVKPEADGPGRCTLWVHPSMPFRFDFDDDGPVQIDSALLDGLGAESYTSRGIVIPADAFEPSPVGVS